MSTPEANPDHPPTPAPPPAPDAVPVALDPPMSGHAIIAGYGLPGRAVAEALREAGVEFCVIERNLDTVRRCLRGGLRIISGDATAASVLQAAGIERAVLFAATMPNDAAVIDAVTQARKLNATVRILARLEYVSTGLKASRRGASEVVVAERVVAAAFKELVTAAPPTSPQASPSSDGESAAAPAMPAAAPDETTRSVTTN